MMAVSDIVIFVHNSIDLFPQSVWLHAAKRSQLLYGLFYKMDPKQCYNTQDGFHHCFIKQKV